MSNSKRYSIFVILLIAVALSNSAMAFDGKHKGFIIGAAIGPSLTMFSQTASGGESVGSGWKLKPSFATDIKIGSFRNEQMQFFYNFNINLFSMTNAFQEKVTIASGGQYLGVAYYLKPMIPTYYVIGGIGLSYWAAPFANEVPPTWQGFGLFGGAGYEFKKHYLLEADLSYGHPSKSQLGTKISANVLTLKISFNILAY